jgi:putative ABC transport system substrate-binding protein
MRRREFITVISGVAAAWPLAARARQGEPQRRIGVLRSAGDDPNGKAQLAAFHQELEQLGWSEGRNLRIEMRFAAGKSDRFVSLARELIALQPDVIVAQSTPVTAILQQETRAIPIVFTYVSDPIGSGFIANLARPGGNLTGVLLYEASIVSKWLALLKEIAPDLTRAAMLANPKTTSFQYFLTAAQKAAATLGVQLIPTPIENDAADIERAVNAFASSPNGGLLLPSDATTTIHGDQIISLAARYRLPAVYAHRLFVEAGGLMSYGTDLLDMHRLAADYVDRILRGTKPAELPVQAPSKYETVLNLKTAKTIGLAVPPSLLVRADEVIE